MPTLVSVFGVEPRRIGGTETFARELSVQLGKRGWKSVLCFLSEPTEEVRQFLDLPNTALDVYATTKDGGLKTGKNLATITRGHRPDILHLHYTGFLNLYSWIARVQSVKKIFFTDHHSRSAGYVPTRAPLWKRIAARFINGPLTKVISVSNYGYECMTAFDLLPRNRFQMIYNGVDLARVRTDAQRSLDFRRRYSIPLERAIVTQVSWIIPEKGISDFLETARLVTSQNRNVQFVMVGDGAYREQYMKDAAAMGIEDRVTWTGMVEDPFGEGVFAAADIVCQFSRWEEVFGWMIAEAMAHGKPVVATRVGGIPELISNGVTGHLVDRGDTRAMSESILKLLDNPASRVRMGQAGRETVSAKFDLRKNVAQLINSYGIS
ncbi:MAG: glycosyltransferase family 4 protein [Acidobacteriota bacterium]|nr:glycosyltransferase family 4 protein [Acidobacteriota bacterium]